MRLAGGVVLGLALLGAAFRIEARQPRLDVPTFAGNPQHTSIYEPAAADLQTIRWSTSIDLAGTFRTTHYGAPLVTAGNSVVVPVKTATDGFLVSVHDARSGALRYAPLTTDYILPPHNWIPVFNPAIARHVDPGTGVTVTRLYYAGAGGTVFVQDDPDTGAAGPPVRRAFYGTEAYSANPGGFNTTVFINTPITADSQGNVFFGFLVQGAAPAPLATTESGYARLAPDGSARIVLASAAAADPAASRTSHNAAPALSNDERLLYVIVKSSLTTTYGYLVGLDAATLAPRHRVFLKDPRNNQNNNATISDDSTASPTVAPDGDVYMGVLGNPFNGARGFLLHFSGDLTIEKTPGAFGWDSTAAIVPASMVPSYAGPSAYLVFAKYNNYAIGDGDGVNRMALLDPASAQTDPHPSAGGLAVMREVLTVIGATPDPQNVTANRPYAVREWCINTAAVNPATRSVLAPNEDGYLYRWDLSTNSLSQAIKLTPGFLEPYVPTVVGPDGTVFTLNGGTLFAIGAAGGPAVTLDSSRPDLRTGVAGEPVTLTARAASTGTMVFTDVFFEDQIVNAVTRELARVPLSGGVAAFSTSTLVAGTHFITATLEGSGASATRVQRVHRAGTVTRVTVASSSGNTFTINARVSATAGTAMPTGMVSFEENGLALAQLPLHEGTAAVTVGFTGAARTIRTTYASDPQFAASDTVLTYPDTTLPAAPAGLTATRGPQKGEVTLRWTPNPASDSVAFYEIWRTGLYSSKFFQVGLSNVETFVDVPPKSKQVWRYYVIARDGAGNASPASTTVRARPK